MNYTKAELSLLLYIEARAVDYGGRMKPEQLNAADWEILQRWAKTGFVKAGRIIMADHNGDGSEWVWLSPEAFKAAQRERRARAGRVWASRQYETTAEKSGETLAEYEEVK